MIFRAVAQSNFRQLPSAVTAERALWANAEKHFKAADRTFEIGSVHYEKSKKGKAYMQRRCPLDNHPLFKMKLKPPRISFASISSYSLDLEAVCFFYTDNLNEFAAARDELNFRILRTFNENHLDFAFPTQSLYVEHTAPKA